jgi:predicted RNase H-like HicB family nuclease
MKSLRHSIKAVIRRGEESGYVAETLEIAVVTQGATLDEVIKNLREAVDLYLQEENLAELGFVKNPTLVVAV